MRTAGSIIYVNPRFFLILYLLIYCLVSYPSFST